MYKPLNLRGHSVNTGRQPGPLLPIRLHIDFYVRDEYEWLPSVTIFIIGELFAADKVGKSDRELRIAEYMGEFVAVWPFESWVGKSWYAGMMFLRRKMGGDFGVYGCRCGE